MSDIDTWGGFLGSDRSERVKKCRQLAAEAGQLAAVTANSEMRASYLELKRQWSELADEMERASASEAVALRS
jgi:hypothetical protein